VPSALNLAFPAAAVQLRDTPQFANVRVLPVIEELQHRLARYPEARWESDASSLMYLPSAADGFRVALSAQQAQFGVRYVIRYNGYSEETSKWGSAITIFGFGLSTGCRLREYSRNGKAYRWVLELADRERWQPYRERVAPSACLLQLWCRWRVRYLQNRVINLDGDDGF
jgi:hypothetical protein